MLADISMAVMAGLLIPVDAPAQPPSETPQVYVELIVKACPADQPDVQAEGPTPCAATTPRRSTKEKATKTSARQRERSVKPHSPRCTASTCRVPPEVMMGDSLTRQACMGHTGYLIAMQYLQENPAYKKSFPDVGEWSCIEHSFPVQGVAGM